MLREGASLVEERLRFRLREAVPGAEVQDAETGRQRETFRFLVARIGADEIAHGAPVTQAGRRVVVRRPLGRPPVPFRRFESVARFLPVVGEDGRALVQLVDVRLGYGARDGRVRAPSPL